MEGLICKKCKQSKTYVEMAKLASAKFGVRGICNSCKALKDADWRNKNREKVRASRKISGRKYLYGLDGIVHFDEQRQIQQGKCAICERGLVGRGDSDHDHETGEWRGVLCNSCNRGLGFFGDSISTLESALKYLAKWK